MIGTGVSTNFTFINLPHSPAGMHCQCLYYQNGLANGIRQRLAVIAPAPATAAAPTNPRNQARKLNPPKPFDGTHADYKSVIMQSNLMFNCDPDRYTGVNTDNAKIAYAVW